VSFLLIILQTPDCLADLGFVSLIRNIADMINQREGIGRWPVAAPRHTLAGTRYASLQL
jgi:hypothetical protein